MALSCGFYVGISRWLPRLVRLGRDKQKRQKNDGAGAEAKDCQRELRVGIPLDAHAVDECDRERDGKVVAENPEAEPEEREAAGLRITFSAP